MHKKKISDAKRLAREYESGASAYDLASRYDCTPQCILGWLKRAGCSIRSATESQKLRYTKHPHPWLGRTHSEADKIAMRKSHPGMLGEKNPNYGKGLPGDLNPNWQGGVSPESRKGRDGQRDKKWRDSILARDSGKCQICFEAKQRMHVHHIRNWRTHPELRSAAGNGITLCIQCHTRISHAGREVQMIPYFENIAKVSA